jgi:hypothetical protein
MHVRRIFCFVFLFIFGFDDPNESCFDSVVFRARDATRWDDP